MAALKHSVVRYAHVLRAFAGQIFGLNRPVKLFLLAAVLYGILINGWSLFFNFYILERGFHREFLGLVNSAPALATLILGFPMGVLADRFGSKNAMFIGLVVSCLCRIAQIATTNSAIILAASFLMGGAHFLYFVSQAPFMMRVSDAKSRTLLFSINFGLTSLSGVLGNVLAGYLPSIFRGRFGISPSIGAYQASLLALTAFGFLAMLPLLFIREPRLAGNSAASYCFGMSTLKIIVKPFIMKLSFPNLLLGIGAALVIPYMNVFFAERFAMSDQSLGLLFSSSFVVMVLCSLVIPHVAKKSGSKIHAVVFTQGAGVIFLLLTGFSPYLWLAAGSFLIRGALMNMSAPLFDAFAMEHTLDEQQATVNSIKEMAFEVGWTVGPYISGVVQETYGFSLLFIATSLLYTIAVAFNWLFFCRPAPKHQVS